MWRWGGGKEGGYSGETEQAMPKHSPAVICVEWVRDWTSGGVPLGLERGEGGGGRREEVEGQNES